jgi:hypothetical protein
MKVQLLHNPIPFSQLPPNSIALDGAVRGTEFDFSNNRWSFDQHGTGQHSLSTRSSAMQTLLALRAGLDVSKIENLFVSSIDADSVIATALVFNPGYIYNKDIINLITMHLCTVDSMGPAGALQSEQLTFHYSLKASYREQLTTELLLDKVEVFKSLLLEKKLFDESEPTRNKSILVSISNNGEIIGMNPGAFSFFDLYSRANIGILYSPEKVTIGIKSSFVTNKNMLKDGLFELFDAAEVAKGAPVNEDGVLIDRWGGKDLVGGSPFKTNTRLGIYEVADIVTDWLKK